MTEDIKVHIGSGNVFADLGLPNRAKTSEAATRGNLARNPCRV